MPDSEMEVRPLRSPESPPTLELALFIMAAIEKFVILDSEDVGLFGCILELSLDLGRKKMVCCQRTKYYSESSEYMAEKTTIGLLCFA